MFFIYLSPQLSLSQQIYICAVLFVSVFCFYFSPQLSLSQQIYICAVQFSQQNLYMCAVWRKSRSFTQGEFSHFPSSHFVQFICAQCGGSGEVGAPGWLSNDCQATQTTGFPGPFRIPSNNFVLTFYPPSFLLYILNIKSKHLATKVSQDGILL